MEGVALAIKSRGKSRQLATFDLRDASELSSSKH